MAFPQIIAMEPVNYMLGNGNMANIQHLTEDIIECQESMLILANELNTLGINTGQIKGLLSIFTVKIAGLHMKTLASVLDVLKRPITVMAKKIYSPFIIQITIQY